MSEYLLEMKQIVKKISGHTGSESCGFQFEIRRSNGIDRRKWRR